MWQFLKYEKNKILEKQKIKIVFFFIIKKNPAFNFIYNLIIDFLWKLEEDCLKNEGRDRFSMKWSFFAFLVCAFHKEPIVASDLNRLYFKNYFEFFKWFKMSDSSNKTLQNKINL